MIAFTLGRTRALFSGAAVALAMGFASAANAVQPPSPPTFGGTPCAAGDITPNAMACVGWYNGNLNGGSPDQLFQSAYALNQLLGTNTYTQNNISWLEDISASGNSVDFVHPLTGLTVVSFHVGGANGQSNIGGVGYNGTAFYEFNAGSTGLDTFSFNLPGLSNARLYSTGGAIPEPGTWALLILGFAGLGTALRMQRRKPEAVVA